MSKLKKSGLGRGLGALLEGVDLSPSVSEAKRPDEKATSPSVETAGNEKGSKTLSTPVVNSPSSLNDSEQVTEIQVDAITRGTYQPRQQFDEDSLQELADSISAQGLIQPILLRQRAGGYELIAGERRWRAAQIAGLKKIPAIVRDMDDAAVAAVTLIENIQREDLNPLEEARALHRLKNEFQMTHQAVADAVGRSRASVTNLIRLLDLDERVAEMLAQGKIEMGHARALLSLTADEQHLLAMKIYAEGLSVRAAEALVRRGGQTPPPKTASAKPANSHIKSLETELSEKLGARVSIDHRNGDKGTVTLSYNSLDELDGILSHIK